MSFQAMTWAIEQDVGSPSARCVLMSIANYANTEWCAWPKQETIAGESVQSVDSVQRRLPELVGARLLRRIKLKRFGRRTHDFYILPPSPFFSAQLEDIRPLLPSSCDVIEDTDQGAADCGSDKNDSPALSPPDPPSDAAADCGGSISATLPQSALHATALVRQQDEPVRNQEIPPSPPRGVSSETLNEAGRKRFQEFKSIYPDGIVDLQAAETEYAGLTEPDQIACNAATLIYAERCRRRKEKSMKAHLFVRKRGWEGLLASPETAAVPSLHEPGSPVGIALRTLGRIARYTPFTLGDGRLSYRGEIGPRLLAMANTPPERSDDDPPQPIWQTYALGTPNFAAWRDFINEVFAGRALPRLTEVYAPWPWPPRRDGTQAATGPPGALASDADLRDFADMG